MHEVMQSHSNSFNLPLLLLIETSDKNCLLSHFRSSEAPAEKKNFVSPIAKTFYSTCKRHDTESDPTELRSIQKKL